MDLWPKSPPAHHHPEGLFVSGKTWLSVVLGALCQCAQGANADAACGFAAPWGAWVPKQDTLLVAHLP